MKKQDTIWVGTDQLNSNPDYLAKQQAEFQDDPAALENPRLESNRRDFLKYLGFGIGAATIAACDIPVRKAIPYVVKPDTIVPGVASYFASTYVQGGDYCPVLVKTREGRPIKIEGNSFSSITGGGTSARAQASVLSLYDVSRFDGPYRISDGAPQRSRNQADNPSWEEIDNEIRERLSSGAQVRVVSHTILSPSTKRALQDFKAAYPNTALVTYDPVSSSALLNANEQDFGVRAVPSYRFDKAEMIVGIDCDFLGTWISPIEYARQYAQTRKITDPEHPKMSRHVQVESYMSLTGSNADNRIMIKPSETGQAILALYNEIVGGGASAQLSGGAAEKIQKLAANLKANMGKSLVVSGSNNTAEQALVNAINRRLNSYGNTIMTDRWSLQRQGNDADLKRLVEEMEGGRVDALIVMDGANPAFDTPYAARFVAGLANVGTKISLSGTPNETLLLCDYVAPTHHYLESWGDAEPKQGSYSLIQPTIAPIFASVGRAGTRQAEESLLVWAESPRYPADAEQPYMAYLQSNWQSVFAGQSEFATFQAFWDSALHDGVLETAATGSVPDYGLGYGQTVTAAAPLSQTVATSDTSSVAMVTYPPAAVRMVAARDSVGGNASAMTRGVRQPQGGESMEISFYETVNMAAGQYANNPWLQEMPDPVTRTTWGNYLSIPVTWDGGNSFGALHGLNEEEYKGKADKVEVTIGDQAQVVTVVRQFGQPAGTVALALGYGRETTGGVGQALGEGIGINVFPWLPIDDEGHVQYHAGATVSERVAVEDEFPSVQYHHSMGLTVREDGELVRDEETGEPFYVDEKTIMTLGEGFQGSLTDRSIVYQGSLGELPELVEHIREKRAEAQKLNDHTLYPYEEYAEDIYSQGHWWAMHIDLNACIGCGACEVACVAENNVPVVGKYEVWRHHEMKWLRIDRYFYGDYENPRTVYQPMMCQHCDNAPCENVCPVNATNHSDEGLNQMTYNRCIGTRYCANNCPYKVRRFNWLDYTTADLFAANEPELVSEELPFGADNLTRMVLNPDVTVRSRGVIEKCSFCVQRIQQGKLTAKRESRRLRDTDVRTACQTACPTGAITFGDRNNRQGEVAERLESPLNYLVLEETNTQSAVFYGAKVHNADESLEA
jgi:molybdopterin-containing oxidoreductase family iron-sulfur binding subunit